MEKEKPERILTKNKEPVFRHIKPKQINRGVAG